MRVIEISEAKRKRRPISYTIDENECWICDSHHKDKDGYPKIRINNVWARMNRYIYSKYNGNIPEGYIVRHKCDNPNCINPNHLEVGTTKDNTMDMFTRGRAIIGEKSVNSKLTEQQVISIKNDSRKNIDIAIQYSVSNQLISRIKKNLTWKHVNI